MRYPGVGGFSVFFKMHAYMVVWLQTLDAIARFCIALVFCAEDGVGFGYSRSFTPFLD
jgi:hypothetical protein